MINQKESKYKDYYKHKSEINKVTDFLEEKLEEAYRKNLDNLVLQEVYSLSKSIRLLDEVEHHIDVIKHIKREQDV